MFVGEKVSYICYVDDLIFWSQNDSEIGDIVNLLIGNGVYSEEVVDAAGFRGVKWNVIVRLVCLNSIKQVFLIELLSL